MSDTLQPLRLLPGRGIVLLDQTELPHAEVYREISTVTALCEAIRALRVRGAPLLGLAAAAGMAIAASERGSGDATLRAAAHEIGSARPTAVELSALADAALAVALAAPAEQRGDALWSFAAGVLSRRIDEDRRMGELGAALIALGTAVLTHCNTGVLATGGIGTALGVIATAHAEGRLAHCYATETRPLLQGARLTAWELVRRGIPGTLLPDGAAASLLASGAAGAVITGADRIVANGDTANKVGTAGLAVLAARFGVPFYVAAPRTTFDLSLGDGAAIPIEQRDAAEVLGYRESRWAAPGIGVYNPAFDVTPGDLITAIITEVEVLRPPYGAAIAAAFGAPSGMAR